MPCGKCSTGKSAYQPHARALPELMLHQGGGCAVLHDSTRRAASLASCSRSTSLPAASRHLSTSANVCAWERIVSYCAAQCVVACATLHTPSQPDLLARKVLAVEAYGARAMASFKTISMPPLSTSRRKSSTRNTSLPRRTRWTRRTITSGQPPCQPEQRCLHRSDGQQSYKVFDVDRREQVLEVQEIGVRLE